MKPYHDKAEEKLLFKVIEFKVLISQALPVCVAQHLCVLGL